MAAAADASPIEKQAVLETSLIGERAELVISILKRQLELMRFYLARRLALQGRTTGARDDALTTARALWLKQQLKAIRQQLREAGGGFVNGGGGFVNGGGGAAGALGGGLGGARHGASGPGGGGGIGGGLGGGGGSGLGNPSSAEAVEAGDKDEVAEVYSRLKTAQLPDTARAVAERELRRLRQMQPMHAEYSVLLNYLDWLAAMPWGRTSEDQLDLNHAREVRPIRSMMTSDCLPHQVLHLSHAREVRPDGNLMACLWLMTSDDL